MKTLASKLLEQINAFDIITGVPEQDKEQDNELENPEVDVDNAEPEQDDSQKEKSEEEKIASAFEDLLANYGFSNISVDAEIENGETSVSFVDDEGNSEVIVFGVDVDEGPYAYVAGLNGDEDDDALTEIDLTLLEPTVKEDGTLDLVNLGWLTKSTILGMLAPFTTKEESLIKDVFIRYTKEDFDEVLLSNIKALASKAVASGKKFTRKFKLALRGEKKLRVPIYQRIKKESLSAKKKNTLKKMRVKSNSAKAIAKRVKSITKGK